MVTELLRGKWEGQGKSCVEILNGAKLSSIWKRSETGKLLVSFPIIRFVSVTMDFSLPPGVLKNICHTRSEHCLLSHFFYNGTQNTHLWFLRQRCEELHPTLSASDQFRLSASISKRVRPGQSNTASWSSSLETFEDVCQYAGNPSFSAGMKFCILHCSRSHGWYCFLRGMKCSKEHKLSHSSFSSQVHRYTTKDLVFPLQRYCIW